MARTSSDKTYLWCDACRRSFTHGDAPDAGCPICQSPMRPMGKMTAILRGIMATELVASDLRTKHRQLVRLIWTRNGMGEQYFRVLAPDMPFNRFETKVTDLLCRGAEEGWVRFILPTAPSVDPAWKVTVTRAVSPGLASVTEDGVLLHWFATAASHTVMRVYVPPPVPRARKVKCRLMSCPGVADVSLPCGLTAIA